MPIVSPRRPRGTVSVRVGRHQSLAPNMCVALRVPENSELDRSLRTFLVKEDSSERLGITIAFYVIVPSPSRSEYTSGSRVRSPSTNGMSFAPPRTSARSARTTHVRRERRSSRDCARRGVAALDLLPLRRPTRERAVSINPTTRSYRRRHHCHHHHHHHLHRPPRYRSLARLPISRPSASSGPHSAAGSPSRSPTPPEPTFVVPRSSRSRCLVPATSYPPPISLRSFLAPDKAPSFSRFTVSFSFVFVHRVKFLSDRVLICFYAV